jgi:hypothetical protein
MEIYILDALLRPIDLIDDDQFISFIWAERYAEKGDFQLVTLSTQSMRYRFPTDTMIMIDDSSRIMRVNTIEDTEDVDQGSTLTIKGFELMSVFEQRVLGFRNASTGDHPLMIAQSTSFAGITPIALMEEFVDYICYPPAVLNSGDEIPYLQPSGTPSLYPASNIPEPGAAGIHWDQKIATLYSALKDVSNAYDLGFRLYKDPAAAKLYFEAYQGADRTSAQSVYPPVIFSSDVENLQNTKEYIDNTTHFNCVIAIYEYTEDVTNRQLTIDATVSDPDLAFTSGGFDQKTKFITISQLPDGMVLADVPAYLEQLASEELTRSRPSDIYDGEIDQDSEFLYERDYYLGDLVEIRGNNGGGAYMRVVEQIIKFDSSGKSSYPSLVSKESITPGTWKSWKYDVNWSDMGDGEYWSNQ